MRDIRPLVEPRSIAVIGASTNPKKAGGLLFANLLRGNFKGKLYPINPNSTNVMGQTAYPALRDVPEVVDLVYIVLPRQHTEAAISECIAARARSACIITAGFAEAGPAGRNDEMRLQKLARDAGLLLAGPNTIGMVNADCGMMGSFVEFPHWEKGGISIFAQTGIFAGGVMLDVMSAAHQRLPASKSIDVGNKIDVDEIDFLDYASKDPATKVVGLYVESIGDPDRFLRMAADLQRTKPVVLLKPARTKEGTEASALHTGTVTPEEPSLDARLRSAGVVRVEDEAEFVDVLKSFAMLPRSKGPRLAIATTSGALGVISTDLVVQNGLRLASFEPATIEKLKTVLPDWATSTNPFDFWTGVEIKGARMAHEIGLETVTADPNVDMVLCTLLAAAASDFPEFPEVLRRIRATHNKPIALVIYGGVERSRWIAGIEGAGIPVFATTRSAVRTLALLAQTGG